MSSSFENERGREFNKNTNVCLCISQIWSSVFLNRIEFRRGTKGLLGFCYMPGTVFEKCKGEFIYVCLWTEDSPTTPHALRLGGGGGLTNFFCRGPDSKDFHLADVVDFSCYPTKDHKFRSLKQHCFIMAWFPQVRGANKAGLILFLTLTRASQG